LAAPPSQSFHIVDLDAEGKVAALRLVFESDLLINAGYFVLRREIFDYIEPGDELVLAPFGRLMKEHKLHGHLYSRFWCMDTFKEHQVLTDMYNEGKAPWEVWRARDTDPPPTQR